MDVAWGRRDDTAGEPVSGGGLMKGPALSLSAGYLGKGLDAVPRNPDSTSPGENPSAPRDDGSVTRWIDGLKLGDQDAAQGLWRRYSGRLVRLALRGWHAVPVPTKMRKMRP